MKWAIIIVGLIVAVAVIVGYNNFYNREYHALKREIERNGNLKIVKTTREEDLTLEYFGFTVASTSWEFEIEIFAGSPVRMPTDRIVGLTVDWREYSGITEIVPVNGSYWKTHNLPPVECIADFLPHAELILNTLAADPPETPIRSSRVGHAYIKIKKKPGVLPGEKTHATVPVPTAP